MNGAIERVLATARSEVGVRENFVGGHYNNLGRRVEEYQHADTLPGVGYSWCVSFIGWDMLTSLGLSLCDQVWLRSASCDAILDWARRHDIVSSSPESGCAGLVLASRNDAVHGFIVDKVLSSAVTTIEGNTNTDGSREGNGVYARKRVLSSRYTYLIWRKLLPATLTLPTGNYTVAPKPPVKSPFEGAPTLELYFGEKRADTVPVVAGRAWLPAYKWATWMNAELGWIPASQTVSIAGREVPGQPILLKGRAWLPVRALAEFSGLQLNLEGARAVVRK